MHGHEREGLVRRERQHPGQHPEQDHAERVDVARGPGRLSGCLFRRDVRGGAEHRPGLGQRARAGDLASEAEIGELRPALLVEEHVGGLEIAVD